jgi:pimeloyl-ACP methyl ester carboxylesterase
MPRRVAGDAVLGLAAVDATAARGAGGGRAAGSGGGLAGAVKAGDVEVIVEGDGPESIVMLHGWPDTHRLWDGQVEALRARYRCVRFTLPGFEPGHPRRAYSLDEVVALIRSVVEKAGPPVTLLLHDWGCFFGYQFALRHPQWVGRIVAVDVGDAGSRRHLAQTRLKAKLQIVGYQLWLAAAWRLGGRLGDRMARWMARVAGAPAPAARITSQMGYPYWMQWVRRGYRQARSFVPASPMLFVYGRRKPFMFHSTGWAQDLAARPGSRVLAFDSGHWVMVEQPEAFNRAVADWLQATDAGA